MTHTIAHLLVDILHAASATSLIFGRRFATMRRLVNARFRSSMSVLFGWTTFGSLLAATLQIDPRQTPVVAGATAQKTMPDEMVRHDEPSH
jgi:hypothetical protein